MIFICKYLLSLSNEFSIYQTSSLKKMWSLHLRVVFQFLGNNKMNPEHLYNHLHREVKVRNRKNFVTEVDRSEAVLILSKIYRCLLRLSNLKTRIRILKKNMTSGQSRKRQKRKQKHTRFLRGARFKLFLFLGFSRFPWS